MSENTEIEWTDATWNPTTGCTKVSLGCINCYAEKLALELQKKGVKKYANGFKLTLQPEALNLPLSWKEPKRIFVNSMSDLFHKDVPDEYIIKVWDVMEKANWHIYQILTKRPERMMEFVSKLGKILPNVWLGTSVENIDVVSRIDMLRETPASIRFLSCEPLLGSLGKLNLEHIDWVIGGGESGPKHRPIETNWVRELRDQCLEKNIAFFFKQWGGLFPKSGGNMLDGTQYLAFPEPKIVIKKVVQTNIEDYFGVV